MSASDVKFHVEVRRASGHVERLTVSAVSKLEAGSLALSQLGERFEAGARVTLVRPLTKAERDANARLERILREDHAILAEMAKGGGR